MDWEQDEAIPMIHGVEFEVIHGGEVRKAKWLASGWGLSFTDCNHPMQNAFCYADVVTAWRLLPGGTPIPSFMRNQLANCYGNQPSGFHGSGSLSG